MKNKRSEPNTLDATKCLAIRIRSKRGELISKDESNFCMEMLSKYEEWYVGSEKHVFNATVPFGSSVRK